MLQGADPLKAPLEPVPGALPQLNLRTVTPAEILSQIEPRAAAPCLSQAKKLIIPIPYGDPLIEPALLPNGQANPEAGEPLTDRRGNLIGTHGIIFANQADNCWQAIPTASSRPKLQVDAPETDQLMQATSWLLNEAGTDSVGSLSAAQLQNFMSYLLKDLGLVRLIPGSPPVVIVNLVEEEDWLVVDSWVRRQTGSGDPNDLTLEQIPKLLSYIRNELGLSDMYNSHQEHIGQKMEQVDPRLAPVRLDGEVIPCYGFMRRSDRPDNSEYFAVLIGEPAELIRPDRPAQIGEEGLVVVVMPDENRGIDAHGERWYCRAMQIDKFKASYQRPDGTSFDDLADLPVVSFTD